MPHRLLTVKLPVLYWPTAIPSFLPPNSNSMDSFGGSLSTLSQNRAVAFDLMRQAVTLPRFDQGPRDRIESQMLVGAQK